MKEMPGRPREAAGRMVRGLARRAGRVKALLTRHELDQFLPVRPRPLGVLRERLLAELAFRDMESAEFTGAACHRRQGFLGAEIAQVELDVRMLAHQLRQLRDRK